MAGTREDICGTKMMKQDREPFFHSFNLNGLYLGCGMLAPCAGRLSKEISPICTSQRQILSLLPFFLFYRIFFNIHVFLLQFFWFLRTHTHTKNPSPQSPKRPPERTGESAGIGGSADLGRKQMNGPASVCRQRPETGVMKRRSRRGAVSAERKKGNHRSISPHRQRRVSVLPPEPHTRSERMSNEREGGRETERGWGVVG